MAASLPSKRIAYVDALHNKTKLETMYLHENMSTLEIAKTLNCTKQAVLYWMKKHQIKRRTISEAISGVKHPNYGKHPKDFFKWNGKHPFQNKTHNSATKRKMSYVKKGKKLSNEHRKKLSLALMGRTSPNKGKKASKATREKLSRTRKGRKHSADIKLKISLSQQGPKGSNWQGGIYPLHESIRKIPKYKKWRLNCFERDNWTCQHCNRRGGNLCVDHIVSYSKIFRDNFITTRAKAERCSQLWDVDNGRTLCVCCHKKTNTYGIGG
jgi:hypothetical protein